MMIPLSLIWRFLNPDRSSGPVQSGQGTEDEGDVSQVSGVQAAIILRHLGSTFCNIIMIIKKGRRFEQKIVKPQPERLIVKP